ncbi:MAG: hypothetical protein NZ874_00135 [Fimbriimonadales bacterium]|nr:hypothetical protein [Fimbriimonadales bacterium]
MPMRLWHGHLARASVARTVLSVQGGLNEIVQAMLCLGEAPKPRIVGGEIDATPARTRLSKPRA